MEVVNNRNLIADSGDNPFSETGVLSRKADFIISNSKITRTSIQIADPDDTSAGPFADLAHDNSRLVSPNASTSFNIEVELIKNDFSNDAEITKVEIHSEKTQLTQPMTAEEVRVKGKRSCCVIL